MSPVPRRHQHYEGATTPTRRITGHLFVSLPVPTRFLQSSCSLRSAPGRKEASASGQDRCSAGDPSCPAHPSCGREWDLPGSQATHPVPLPRSKTPAELTIPCLDGLISAAPASITAKASADGYIKATAGLQHLLSTLQEWCCHHHMQDSLPAGWLAFTGRESNPLDRVERLDRRLRQSGSSRPAGATRWDSFGCSGHGGPATTHRSTPCQHCVNV